ncbi:aldo/keto reductase [bacterium]|nr:aldo/keto reductase [bacterium]UNM09176.1 MAG: aldo/keto reductase [Planctomycetales bacterium]
MEMRKIGSLSVSAIGLGCNNFGGRLDSAQTTEVVSAALDSGINLLDTADIYGATKSEEYLGQALRGRRDRAIVATKFGMRVDDERQGAAPAYVRQACEDSLRRLGMDTIDLYWLHQPDPSVPIADTLAAMHALVTEGKVREIACSNFSAAQLREADKAARQLGGPRFVAVQNEYSLFVREPEGDIPTDDGSVAREETDKRGVLKQCDELGISFVPYFPLASGLLTGKYHAGQPAPDGTRLSSAGAWQRFGGDERIDTVERLRSWCADKGHSLLELAHSWLLRHSCVASVISGATKPGQAIANAAAGDWKLNGSQLTEIEEILAG